MILATDGAAAPAVTAGELVRQFGTWQARAAAGPVFITHHGRTRLVMLSLAAFEALATRPGADHVDTPPVSHVLEHLEQGFLALDGAMRVRAINAAACGFLMVSAEAVRGRALSSIWPGIEDRPGYAALRRAVASGATTCLELPSFARAGRWLRLRAMPFADGSACLFDDITDAHAAQRRNDVRDATLAALAAHGDVGRAVLSTRGTFAEVDAAFAGLAGFAPDKLHQVRLTDILPLSLRRAAADQVEAVLAGTLTPTFATRFLTRGGTEKPVRLALAPVHAHGAVTGAVVIATAAEDSLQPIDL
ncbi:PAS domain-containing protein [uncultured Sphingomonas sp.]|uniref:PAS domain-containing protein n=1 Tax=uncultured Sphingomonas sp. TaxID=158754 RepID=UPI00262BE2D3|nr:PAS domain-containing protein [uncultured Sphingomonas sp.]